MGSEPVSVILPTLDGEEAVLSILNQLKKEDEILVVCDFESDPIASSKIVEENRVNLILAGEAENCSGKANAIYYGMKEAQNPLVVWTDDDFDHVVGWLDNLREGSEKHGAVSELPFFKGSNPLSLLTEPVFALVMTGTILDNSGWGGSLAFDRNIIDEEKFLEELSSTVSDDALISHYVDFKVRRKTRIVELDENISQTLNRITRFLHIVRYHEPLALLALVAFSLISPIILLLWPLYSSIAVSASLFAVYLFLGQKRLTFLLSYFSLLMLPLFLIYGLSRETFEWRGRRYRYNSKFEIELLE